MGPWGYNKYKNKRVTYDGYSFASQMEAAGYTLLKSRENDGEIKDIECQVSVYLTKARILFKPDFRFFHIPTGVKRYVEIKGFKTASYNIKKRLWQYYGDGILEIYEGSHKRLYLAEVITPKDDTTDE